MSTSAQSFILKAIAEKAELEEQHANFDAEADARFAKIVESGKTIPWNEMLVYLEERGAGKDVQPPMVNKGRDRYGAT